MRIRQSPRERDHAPRSRQLRRCATTRADGGWAANVLKTAPTGYKSMDAFGQAAGWGTGKEGTAQALQRAGTITRDQAKALGISAEDAFKIRDAYRAVLNDPVKGANNPSALGREALLNKIGKLLSE
jgi:hypothetical protein